MFQYRGGTIIPTKWQGSIFCQEHLHSVYYFKHSKSPQDFYSPQSSVNQICRTKPFLAILYKQSFALTQKGMAIQTPSNYRAWYETSCKRTALQDCSVSSTSMERENETVRHYFRLEPLLSFVRYFLCTYSVSI